MKDVTGLPFDQYQRYRLVADLLDELRGSAKSLSVLDVGGRTALLRSFLTKDKITLVDVEESDSEGLILGDGARLPFVDGAFDAVCAFDTLEHVPPELREAFVSECRRVSKSWVVLAGPYHTARVARAEKLLGKFMKDKLGIVHRYLQEHADHGLPVRKDVEAQLAGLGGQVHSFGHANLDRWLVLMCLSMYLDDDPSLRKLATSFHRFYNRSLYASDHAAPVYRHLVVAAFDGARMPDADQHLAPPVAPKGALEPFESLTTELLAFDKEREEWRAERDRLRQVVEDLRQDLAGSRASLADRARDAAAAAALAETAHAEAEAQRATLEHDLEGHRSSIADLKRELAEVHASTELDRAEERKVREGLERDLEEHRKALEQAASEVRAAQVASAEQRAALETDLAEHAKSLADLRRELEAAHEQAAETQRATEQQRAALEANLAEHAKALSELHAELDAVRADTEAQRRAFEADLGEHKKVIAAREDDAVGLRAEIERLASEATGLRAEVERLQGEVETLAASHAAEVEAHATTRTALGDVITQKDRGIEKLEQELVRVEGVAADLQANLERSLGEARGLGADLDQRTAEVAMLRGELRNRWRNLLRAFAFGKSKF